MHSRYVTVCDRELHYTEFGSKEGARATVVLWHGLMRTCRDFDFVATALAERGYHVICPDTIGRGLSQWSPNPADEYSLPFYVQLAEGLLNAAGVERCCWVGTSMGGLIGLLGAATTLRSRIDKLLLNDIGPQLQQEALSRITKYGRQAPVVTRFSELESYFAGAYKAAFGIDDEQFLRAMMEHCTRRMPDGRITTHYDPDILLMLEVNCPVGGRPDAPKLDLWSLYESLTCPILVLRGEKSDLLGHDAAEDMVKRNPRTNLVVVPNVGHAPAFNNADQIMLVVGFISM